MEEANVDTSSLSLRSMARKTRLDHKINNDLYHCGSGSFHS